MVQLLARVVLVCCLFSALAAPARAQDAGGNEPGRFDFYVLSLSWSPSFCAAATEQHGQGAGGPQCGARPYSFVVHGLWPQYEKGFPEYCERPSPRLDHRIVSSMLDLMPAPRLIYNEWDKHGTCSGLSQRDYFDAVRKARAVVKIPPAYVDLKAPLTVSPGAVADAFVKANPDLAAGDFAVECDRNRLSEIRFCLSKDMKFRACAEVARRACKSDQVTMPPMRGGPAGSGN
jgi:ribonuclease T2